MTLRLGQKVVDPVTGFEGRVTAICKYYGGRVVYLVESNCDNPDRTPNEAWYDEERLLSGQGKGRSEPQKSSPPPSKKPKA